MPPIKDPKGDYTEAEKKRRALRSVIDFSDRSKNADLTRTDART